MGSLKDRIPAGVRFEREFPGDGSWNRFKLSYGAKEYYSGPSRIYPCGVKVRFTLPEGFVRAEQIHLSREQIREDGKGQRCKRCGLMLVLWPETPFAAGHDICVDTRDASREFGMCDTTEPLSAAEAKHFASLPLCQAAYCQNDNCGRALNTEESETPAICNGCKKVLCDDCACGDTPNHGSVLSCYDCSGFEENPYHGVASD